MCLILFAYRVVPGVPLVVAANRDEYHARPTAQAGFWQDRKSILAGRDLQAGGTWLGVNTGGRFAALTNFRGKSVPPPGGPSRGELVSRFLSGRQSARAFARSLEATGHRYAGFGILVSDDKDLYYYSNQSDRAAAVEPGVHGLSNHLLDTPWPKVVKGRQGLERLLTRPYDDSNFLSLMDDTVPAAEKYVVPGDVHDPAWERSLSSLRIVAGDYGTRCSTVVRILGNQTVDFAERSYRADGEISGEVRYRIGLTARSRRISTRGSSQRAQFPPRKTPLRAA